ncbi:MAG: aminomethyl transferase family protein [Candidatus Omnitrophica bacterium]|nr:aminomethyl transferase family protein [Candidatus Omnitrophota bacterium]
MIRDLPLNPLWESLGATLKVEQDWRIPSLFKDFQTEYHAVRKAVGLIDQSYRGKIEVTGKDRAAFLHRMLSNDIQNLGLGNGCYAALLTATGKILMDMNVLVFANSILLGVDMGMEKRLISHLNKYLINEDVKLRDITEDFALLALQGPRSEALAHTLFPGPFPELSKRQHGNFHMGDVEVTVIRISRTGEWGYHLTVAKENAMRVAERVMVVGKLYGLQPVGHGTSEILRIEAGVLRYGIDVDEDISLPETGLEGLAASETKGCYPGQEVVARVKTYGGLQRKMTGFVFERGPLPGSGNKVLKNGLEAGWITSACFSPTLGKGIALGYVTKEAFGMSEEVMIKTADSEISARTRELPFISSDKPRS